jgi:hypothetical protein
LPQIRKKEFVMEKKVIEKKLEVDVLCIKQVLSMVPVVKEQVQKFHGKVFNVRLKNAINDNLEGYNSISIIPRGNMPDKIIFHCGQRSIQYNGTTIYSDYYDVYHLYCDNIFSEKRIDASAIIPYLEDCRENLEKQLINIAEDKKRLDRLALIREKLINSIEEFNDLPLSTTARECFEIGRRK